MIHKYKEDLNDSLSYISEFDLEAENDNLDDDSFNSSSFDESDVEEIEIKSRIKKNIFENDQENDKKLEKEWHNIKEQLLNGKEA